jgi:hypothetical protein
MAHLLLEALTPGMKLSKPVSNANGVLLLREGEVLTAKHLEIFKTWGVREAEVVQADGTEPKSAEDAADSPEILAAVSQEMARRFRRVDTAKDPVMADILRAAKRRLAARLTIQGAAVGADA